MNKKIIALIIIIPVVLMVTIFSVVKGASLIRDIPVSNVEFLNVGEDGYLVRYIDEINQEDLFIQARVLPLNAKNKTVKFSLEDDFISLSDGQSHSKVAEIDATTGKVNIYKVGKVKIFVESADGGYKQSCILDVRQRYTPASDFDIQPSNIENQLIFVNDEFEIKTSVTPIDAHYKYVNWQSSDDKIIRFISSSNGVAKFKAISSGEVTLTGTLDLHNLEYEPIIKTVTINVLGEKATEDKVIERIELIGIPQQVYFINDFFQNNLNLKVYFKRSGISYTEIIPLVPQLISGFDTTTPKEATYAINYQGKEIIVNYQVKQVEVQQIDMPESIRVRLNGVINLDDYLIKITYNNGIIIYKELSNLVEEGTILLTNQVGTFSKEIIFEGFTTYLTYQVVPKVLASFEYLSGLKEQYTIGDSFPIVKIKVKYSDKLYPDEIIALTSAIQYGFVVSGFDTSIIVDNKELTIYHQDNPTNQLTYFYKVVGKDVTDIKLLDELMPFKLNDEVNNHIRLLIKYDDGSLSEVTLDKIIANDQFNTSTSGRKVLIINYGGITFELIYHVLEEGESLPTKVVKDISLYNSIRHDFYLNEDLSLMKLYLKVTYEGNDYNPLLIEVTQALMEPLSTNISGTFTSIIELEEKSCEYQYNIYDISTIVINGLNEQYDIWDEIDYQTILPLVYYGPNLQPIEINFNDLIIEAELPKNNQLGQKTISASYQGFDFTFGYQVMAKTISEITISGLAEQYFEDDLIDPNNIVIKVTYEDGLVKSYQLNSEFINLITALPNTHLIGSYVVQIAHFGEIFIKTINVVPRGITGIDLIGIDEVYLLGQVVNLADFEVIIYYENQTSKKETLTIAMIDGNFIDTLSIGSKLLTIRVYDVKNDSYVQEVYNYRVFDALLDYDDIKTLSTSVNFTLTVQKDALNTYGFNSNYHLLAIPSAGIKEWIINKNGNGNFDITIILSEDAETVNFKYLLTIDGYSFDFYKELMIELIDLESAEITLDIVDTIAISYGENAIVNFKDSFLRNSVTQYLWSSSDLSILTVNPSNNYATLNGLEVGEVTISVTIYVNEMMRTLSKTVNVIKTYEGLAFLDASKTFGIGNELVIGSLDIFNNEFVVAKNYFALRAVNFTSVNMENIVWQVCDEFGNDSTLASFDGDGNLHIFGDGIVILKANDRYHIDNNIITTQNTATLKVRVIKGVNIYNYDELRLATENTANNATTDFKKIIIRNNIDIGPKMINIDENNKRTIIYNDLQARQKLAGLIKKMPTTADWTYYKNIGSTHPEISYLIEFKSDVYGNGFTLDAYNITTLVDSTNTPKTYNPFKGPLDFVKGSLGGDSASVKAQDNIVFLVRDNVTINNITLQSCDDNFLIKTDENGSHVDLAKLNYVGTTVEVMGDNVNILNSRLKNGRTVLRIFGTENPDDIINVRIESSILLKAREFVLKIGTNKDKLGDLSNPSPKLESYLPEGNYMKDASFVDNYVKTNVLVKNVVIETAGFFSIGMESKFAGTALAGGPPNLPGWTNLAGTSYVANLKFEDDVRLYDWKDIDYIDASTLIEGYQMAFDIQTVLTEAQIKQPELADIVTKKDGKTYVHGGIAFFGGGKNYHILDLTDFTGPNYQKYYIVAHEYSGSLSGAILKAAGPEPFRFYMYGPNSGISYDEYLYHEQNALKYNWIRPVK